MTRKTSHLGGQAFQAVFGFTIRYWRKQPARIATVASLALLAALADVLTPLFAGRLVDALSTGLTDRAAAWHSALVAFGTLAALGIGATVLRQGVYLNIITLTLKMMSEIAAASFHRVQRFSTDWHANSFAG